MPHQRIVRPVIDAHVHIFPDAIAVKAADRVVEYYGLPRQGTGEIGDLLAHRMNFSDLRYVVCSAALKSAHVRNGNDFLLTSAGENSHFIPLASFHPDMPANEGVAEIERVKNAGAKGIKLHPDFQGFAIDDPKAFPFYQACADLDLPILFHTGDETSDLSAPRRIYTLLNRFPTLRMSAAHMCGYQAWDEAEEILIGTPIYTDTSDALLGMEPVELTAMIRRHGVDKVMFGSDYPLLFSETAFRQIDALELTEEEKTLIFSENAKRFYHI